jgi:hypothetical protein
MLTNEQLGWVFGDNLSFQRTDRYQDLCRAAKRADQVARWRAGGPYSFHLAVRAAVRFMSLAQALLRRANTRTLQ